ncbi:MAG: hypothetical protein PF508_08815 [Spirochaeta sp.]|nr:hypothetical protein [Spirochaeta sp.]
MSDQLHYLDTSVVLAWLLEGSDVLAPLEGSRRAERPIHWSSGPLTRFTWHRRSTG